ncbi:hypothetical protein CS537_08030 [Yersinia mollaretii]|nr:hypothetical protein CS537_08030 [Yersinia mollaretii]
MVILLIYQYLIYKMVGNKKPSEDNLPRAFSIAFYRHLEDSLTVFQHTSACKTSQDDGDDGD